MQNPYREVHEYLNKYVVGQEEAKRILSVVMFNHYLRIQALEKTREIKARDEVGNTEKQVILQKSNVLLVGPSGSGKTLMSKHLAEACGLPFTVFDCSTLTCSGYVGGEADDIIKSLLVAAGNDENKARYGLVVLDEIDKIRKTSTTKGKDVNGLGAQQALLKLIEGKEVVVGDKRVETTNILFIAAGAFVDVNDIIYARLDPSPQRPQSLKRDNPDLLKKLIPKDLMDYGIIPELVGRIPILVTFDQWMEEQEDLLLQVLMGTERSILKEYQWVFECYGTAMTMTMEAAKEVAKLAVKQMTGARGLRTIMEKVLLQPMYEVPDNDILSFEMTVENIRDGVQIEYTKKKAKGSKGD